MRMYSQVRKIARACGRAKTRHRTRMVRMPSDVGTPTTRKKNRGMTYGDAYLNLATTHPRRRKTFTGGIRGGIIKYREPITMNVIDPELGKEVLRLTRLAERRLAKLHIPMTKWKYYLAKTDIKGIAFSNLQRHRGVHTA